MSTKKLWEQILKFLFFLLIFGSIFIQILNKYHISAFKMTRKSAENENLKKSAPITFFVLLWATRSQKVGFLALIPEPSSCFEC